MNTTPTALQNLLEQKKWAIRLLLLAAIAAGTMASDMYVPSLPSIADKLHVSAIAVKWTLSIYLFGFASLQLIYGPLSDRFGRKPVFLLGFAIGFLGSFLCAMATNITLLLVGRLIQGMGVGAGATLGRSIVQDLYQDDSEKLSKAISSLMMAFSIAPIIAPVFGGYLQQYWGWHSVFIVFCVYLSIIGTLFFFMFPETHLTRNPHALHLRKLWTLYKKMLGTPSFLVFTLLSGVSFGGILAYYAISPFLYQNQLGLSAVQYGWLALVTAVVLVISRGLNIILARRWAIPARLKIGLFSMWLGPVIMSVFALFHQFNIGVILFPYMIFMLGSGLVMPNAMISAISEFNHAKGSAAGLYTLCQLTVVFIITVTASHLEQKTQISLALLLLTTTVLAQSVYVLYRRYSRG